MEPPYVLADVFQPIQVLRIPANRTGDERFGNQRLFQLPRVNYQNIEERASDEVTNKWESDLGHIPDLSPFKHNINLKNRLLFHVQRRASATGNSWNEDYFMYKCIEPTRMRLPKNHYSDLTNAYGDVFVFTLDRYQKFVRRRAVYGPMRDFKDSIDRIYAVGWARENMLRETVLREAMFNEVMFREDNVRREAVSREKVWEGDMVREVILRQLLEYQEPDLRIWPVEG